jgi:hypothetical protein
VPDLDSLLDAIDTANAADSTSIPFEGTLHPQAWIEGRRAHHWVLELDTDASDPLQLAARAHHIRRWELPRSSYPRTRTGYLEWRTKLYDFHADTLAGMMRDAGYDEADIQATGHILHKRGIKTDLDAQTHEDAVSVAFLELRLASFAPTVDAAQLLNALRRTWRKMSDRGRAAALTLDLSPEAKDAVERALA